MGYARDSGVWVKEGSIELRDAGKEIYVFARKHAWKKTARNIFQWKYWGWWATLIFSIAASVCLAQYHTQIVTAIGPYKIVIRRTQAWNWLVPFIVLIIISFPPLFGHELVILALGVCYRLDVAFLIAIAGTFAGEVAEFYVFKHYLTRRAAAVEAKSVGYASLAKLMREGGVTTSIIVRFSAIPGHIVTALQATIGISIWVYSVAAIVSLPKQFALVYLGNVFGQTTMSFEDWRNLFPNAPSSRYYNGDDSASRRHKISLIVFAVTTLSTLFAAGVIYMRVRKVRPFVLKEMEQRRLAKEALASTGDEEDSPNDIETVELSEACASIPPGRPQFIPIGSSAGSRVALLSGRGRSDTANSSSSRLSSPSLPHLPLYEESAKDYFGDLNDDKTAPSSRRGSF